MDAIRLRSLRKSNHNMTQAQVAKKLGVATTTYASYEQGKREPDNNTLTKLAGLFNVTTDYLLGNPVTLHFSPETASHKEIGDLENLLRLENGSKSGQTDFTATTATIPVYGEIHAGTPCWADENIIGDVPITNRNLERFGGVDNLFGLQIIGDSMNKIVLEGYTAVFEKTNEAETGDVVAVIIDHDDATIKRFRRTSRAVIFEPDSTNPVHRPIVFTKEQIVTDQEAFKIIGKYLYATNEPI